MAALPLFVVRQASDVGCVLRWPCAALLDNASAIWLRDAASPRLRSTFEVLNFDRSVRWSGGVRTADGDVQDLLRMR
jgi:hypothetical protein